MHRYLLAVMSLALIMSAPAFANLTDTSHIHLRGRITTNIGKDDPGAKTAPVPTGIDGVQVSARLLSHNVCVLDRQVGDAFVDAINMGRRSTATGTTNADGTWEIVMNFPRAYNGTVYGLPYPEWVDCLNFVNGASASDFELSANKSGYSFRRR